MSEQRFFPRKRVSDHKETVSQPVGRKLLERKLPVRSSLERADMTDLLRWARKEPHDYMAISLRVNRFFLHKEVSRLDAALEALESVNQNSAGARPKRERKPMSLSARKRTAAQRARWKKMEET